MRREDTGFRELEDGLPVWGYLVDDGAIRQLRQCLDDEVAVRGALMADHHLGYSQPIGGVVAYRDHVSPSGVGYDIACGVKAVQTDMSLADITGRLEQIADQIQRRVSFGVGRRNPSPVDHDLFDSGTWKDVRELGPLRDLAYKQLGTVGSGNHYVDVLVDEADGSVWVACHFGSRGFGHKVASGFLNLAAGRSFQEHVRGESDSPTLIPLDCELGGAYWASMELAGRYAYAGRDHVAAEVLSIFGANAVSEVHNHHNYAWRERHAGEDLVVVRKGATPIAPDRPGFVGGSMGDIAAVVAGRVDAGERATAALGSTVHGAGRVMSRTQAAGKRRKGTRVGGQVSPEMMREAVDRAGVVLRGGGADESPHVYRRLDEVLAAHADTITVTHRLRPLVVVMAGADEFDPFKD